MGSKSIIDLAIFDLGGTVCDGIDEATGLANIGPINALKFSLKEVWDIDPGYDVILPHMATRKLDHLYAILTTPSITEEFIEKHGRPPTREDAQTTFDTAFKRILEIDEMPGRSEPFPGVIEMFEGLRAKDIKVGINTGFYAKAVRIILANFGNNHLIESDVGADEVSQARPYPYMMFKAMDDLGIADVHRVMKVGDVYPTDFLEGYNLGGISVGVTECGNTRPASAWKPITHNGRELRPVDWFGCTLKDKDALFRSWLNETAEKGTRLPYPMVLIPHSSQLNNLIDEMEQIEELFCSFI
jgi:phosphonoacetaldehyde hydrolase